MLVGCLTSQQQASVSQGRICSDNFTCCHTEIEAADPTFYLTQSQYTDTGPTSPSADPKGQAPGQGSHWSANFEVTGMTRHRKKSRRKWDSNPGPSALEADALTTRPTRRSEGRRMEIANVPPSELRSDLRLPDQYRHCYEGRLGWGRGGGLLREGAECVWAFPMLLRCEAGNGDRRYKPAYRVVGLVVKASASGTEDPGFESCLRRNFSGSSHTSDFKIGTPVATLPGAWHHRVSAGTGRPDVSIL